PGIGPYSRLPPPCGEGSRAGLCNIRRALPAPSRSPGKGEPSPPPALGGSDMSDFDLTLAGTVVLPDLIIENGYVAVRQGKIVHVGEGRAPSAHERHELGNALILPGAIDAQVHSLSQKDQE